MHIRLNSAYRSIHKLQKKTEVILRDRLHHEKDTPSPFRLLGIYLFFLAIIEVILRFLVVLFYAPEKSFEILYKTKNERMHAHVDAYSHFRKYHARVRVFTATGGMVIVLSSMMVGLTLNLLTGVYRVAQAATYSWTQTSWNTLTSNTTGHPAPGNWTEYAATTTSIVGGTTLTLGTSSGTAVDDGAGLSAKTDYAAMTQPEGVAISPDGTSVYVTSQNNNTVSMYTRNTTTGTLSGKTDYLTGNIPGFITISSDGTSVYVVNISAYTVSMYTRNTTTGTLSAKTDYATGVLPYDVTISSDGTSVYVPNYGSNTVSRYVRNTTTGALSARIDYPGAGGPWNSAISADGTSLYVVNRDGAIVSMYARDTTTGTLSAKTDYATGAGPYGVAVSPDGTSVYTANISGSSVSMYTRNTTTGTLSGKTDFAAGATPYNVTVSPDGRSVYVPNSNTPSTLSVFSRNTTTGALSARIAYTTGSAPHDVAVSPDGTSVYVPNYSSATVSMFNIALKGGALGFESGTNASTVVSGTGSGASVGLEYPFSATGGTITTSGAYTIHTFTSSGTFQLGASTDVEYLVVAGGGGGGGSNASNGSGGGGAGGYRTGTLTSVSAGSYSVTVGAGGAGVIGSSDTAGVAGSNSVFSTITSAGGGYGAGSQSSPIDYRVGGPGGSGGGGASTIGGGGSATPPGQGNNGGRYTSGFGGGGGGGAGAAPGDSLTGGAGLSSSISGAAVTYARGGDGATISPTSGAANTGNGGQGVSVGASNAASGNGGSGIVIVRYTTPAYLTPGTFTSAVIDTGIKKEFTTLSYSTTLPANTTITIDVRAGDVATPDGTWTAWQTNIASGGSISGLGSNRYVQYRANLATSDTSVTPTLNDITFNYDVYTSGATLTSTAFNSTQSANLMGTVSWNEDAVRPSGTYIGISVRSAATAGELATGTWATFSATTTGCSKVSTTVSCPSALLPPTMNDGVLDNWFQYQAVLGSDGTYTPTISDITISYVFNAVPELQNVTAVEQSDGTVLMSYDVRDPDTSIGSVTPGYITPSFEYSLDNGSSWTAISANLSAGATANKTVSEVSWATYTAVWTAKTELNGTYATSAKIRVMVNDNEAANNSVKLESLGFALDEKNPTMGSIPVKIEAIYSPALLSLDASDDSAMQMRVSRLPDLSDASWVEYSTSTTIALVSEPDTVYVEFRDAFLNTSAVQAVTTPVTPTNIIFRDLSNMSATPAYRLFISWTVVPIPGPGFGNYRIYRSTDGTSYSLYSTISNRLSNYLLDDNLSDTTTYYYKIYADDVNMNTSYYSGVVSHLPNGQGGTDATPPTITGVSSTTTTQTASINWTTDELSNSSVGYCVNPCSDFSSTQGVSSYVTSHEVILSGLAPGQTYDYIVNSTDPSLNIASSSPLSFTTLSGPSISNVAVIKTTNSGADISWNTDIPANASVAYATNTPPEGGVESIAGLAAFETSRTISLMGLSPATAYYFYVQSRDASDNLAEDRNIVNGVREYYKFNTSNDVIPPVISSVATSSITDVFAVVSWQTDEPATTFVEWGTAPGVYGASASHSTFDSTHYVELTGLSTSTLYYFRVTSMDQNGNTATSSEYSFITLEKQYGESERIIEEIVIVQAGTNVIVQSTFVQGIAQDVYDKLKDSYDVLQVSFDELQSSLESTLAELNTIKNDVLGLKEDDPTDPKSLLRIVSEKFALLSKIYEKNATLDITEEDLAPSMQTLRDLAEVVPPPIIKGAPEIQINSEKVEISWSSDRETNSVIAFAKKDMYDPTKENPYVDQIGLFDVYSTEHKVTLSNLLPSTEYHFQIRSATQLGKTIKTSDYSFTTPVQLPEITKANVRTLENGRVQFSWHTNVLTNAAVRYTPFLNGKPEEDKAATFGKPEYTNDHIVIIEQFESGTTYGIELLSADLYGNTARRDLDNLTTGKDTEPAEISQIRTDITVFPGAGNKIQAIVFWKTDELATSQVLYEEGVGALSDEKPKLSTIQTVDMSMNHTVVIANWKSATVYRFRVLSVDSAGNIAESKDFTIKTPRQKASIIDIIANNFSQTFNWTKNIGL